MFNKRIKWLLWSSMVLCCGCVDNNYDLNKDIVMDVTIEGNKINLPIGDFKPIVLDSVIDVEDIDLLEKMNGIYSLRKSDVIDPIDIEIDPIKINIDPITHSSTFQFEEVTIEEAVLNEVVKEQVFGVNEVSIDDLNQSLPTLETSVTKELYTPEMQNQIESLKVAGGTQEISIPLNGTFSTEIEKISFELDYELPTEIKEISDITLHNLIQFEVTNPQILSNVDKTISFTATFPEEFVLKLDENAYEASKYKLLAANKIQVNNVIAQGDVTVLQFYIDEMNDLQDKHSSDRHILFNDEITYQVEYALDGIVPVSANTDLNEFKFLVDLDHKVLFTDAKGSTNDIDVDFEQMDFDFSAHFDNLDLIKEVQYIEFDAANSKIHFTTNLGEGGFAPFNLKDGYQLKLTFPEKFILDLDQCVYPQGTIYNESEHAFFINDVNVLNGFKWDLAIDRIEVYKEVIDHKCDLDAIASISVVSENGILKLGGTELESMNSTLEKLKSKNVVFTMAETHLQIDDAVVLTEVIHEEIEEYSSFSVNEKIDDGVSRINGIEFYDKVPIVLDIELTGVEDLSTDVHLSLDVTLPSFLILSSDDERVNIHDGKMTIDSDYNPQSKKLQINMMAEKILFSGDEFPNGIELKDSIGSYYLDYNADVPIIGDAYIDETEMHSTILGKDIGIDVNFNIGEMKVKNFSGIYCGKIDDIQESIDFDLGEELDFLKEEGNTITLSDPQIEFTIDNPVCIPVDMALSLFGKDDNGNVIETSCIETVIRLEPAEYNETTGDITTRDMKYLLTNKETPRTGYTNIVIPELSNLLKRIPNSLDIELKPTIDESVTHHVDLSKDLVFHPEYNVVVPIKFDNIHIEYTELVEDLNKDLGEALEYFTNVELKVDMNIRNTIPVGLRLSIEPLDIHGQLIEGVEIKETQIAAGNGKEIDVTSTNDEEYQKLQLSINSTGDALRNLDKLNLLIIGNADETIGGIALTPEQGLHIMDVVVEIIGDFETNLDEL